MSGGSTILELRSATAGSTSSGGDDTVAEPDGTAVDYAPADYYGEDDAPPRDWTRALTIGAITVSLLWVAGMVWLSWASLTSAPPVALAGFIAALCVPPALIGIILLLTLRTSTAEARRFGITAHAMRAEAAALERTVAVLSGVIDANRDKLADQTTALMAMGDGVADRLRSVGTGMAAEVRAADANARQLTDATDTAHAKLTLLMGLLPRARDETSEVAGLLERTGVTASESAAALDAQIVALAERGREADAVAGGAAQRLAAHITRMEVTSETAGARLESVTAAMSEAVDGLLGRTAEAVDEARKGIAAQGDAMLAMLGTNQAALDSAAHDSAVALAERISAIEAVVDRVAARLDEQRAVGDSVVRELDTGFERVAGQLDALHAQGVDRTQSLAATISALGGSADAMTEALRSGDAMATTAIATTDRLLTALDAAAREIDETLPEALARLDGRIGDSRRVVAAAKPELLALVTAAESTHDAIEAIAQVIGAQRATLDKLSVALLDTLTSGQAKADALGRMVEDTIGTTNRLAEEAAPRLVEMLLRVRDTATTAAERARETLATVIPDATQALETASMAALERASAATVERQIESIGRAANAAAAAAGDVAERLANQLAMLDAQTATVEHRIDDARAEREAAEQDSFARRVSLLIESLNSASIDIAKAFSAEVSDSAWAAYLKGDRGVFTRRAVRLLDANEAREIARLYDDEPPFREQVNRYIHDFEAMLRAVLAQRDGSPLGVTMLSSDMGKLYVALAQAIERLRT